MSKINLIKQEINLVKSQTDKLIADIETDMWLHSPDVLNTNLHWQIGHIFLANYLHGIASITGVSQEIRSRIDVKQHIKFFGMNSDPLAHHEEKPTKEELLQLYELGFELIHKGLDNMDDSNLEQPTEIPNPAAKTKYEALMWLFKHQSWHNGQIATLKRILKNR